MNTYKRQQGFTLVEVMVAIVVLTIGILAAALMQTKSIDGNSRAVRLTRGSTWAQHVVERFISHPYNHADLQDTDNNGAAGLNCPYINPYTQQNPFPAVPCQPDGVLNIPGTDIFTIGWNVANDFPVLGCKTVRVVVQLRDTEGAWRPPVSIMEYVKMGPI